ncbi:hypothetical protein ABIE00_002490 [Arthrobacter sp. OAP107]
MKKYGPLDPIPPAGHKSCSLSPSRAMNKQNRHSKPTMGQVKSYRRAQKESGSELFWNHVVLPRTFHEEQERPPKRCRRNLVNTPRCTKETRTKFFTGHVGRAINAHEVVTNNNPSIQKGKEAARHSSTCHQ